MMALTRSETDLGEVDLGTAAEGELLICNSDFNPLCLHPARSFVGWFARLTFFAGLPN